MIRQVVDTPEAIMTFKIDESNPAKFTMRAKGKGDRKGCSIKFVSNGTDKITATPNSLISKNVKKSKSIKKEYKTGVKTIFEAMKENFKAKDVSIDHLKLKIKTKK